MKGDDIKITDFFRIIIGEVPGGFYVEVIIRVFFIYLVLLLTLRLMGKRMASSISRTEMVAVVSLAAAVGMPLQTPERGLLPALVIALVVVFVERTIAYYAFKYPKFEKIAEDDISILVEDSVMNMKNMEKTRIPREFLYAQLRSRGILQLGEVKRFYIEANGAFTLIREQEVKPGLSIIPDWDQDFYKEQELTDKVLVCKNCGNPLHGPLQQSNCERCHSFEWVKSMETI